MADKQISDLTAATGLTDGSLFVIEQNGAAKNANWGMIKEYISPSVASQYSTSDSYSAGDYVIYNNNLYCCLTDIVTPESWTASHWAQVILADEIAGTKAGVKMEMEGNLNVNYAMMARVGRVFNGLTFSMDNNVLTVNGTSTGVSLFDLFRKTQSPARMPFLDGHRYYVRFKDVSDTRLYKQISYQTTQNASVTNLYQSQVAEDVFAFTLPNDLYDFYIRVFTNASGNTYSSAKIEFYIYELPMFGISRFDDALLNAWEENGFVYNVLSPYNGVTLANYGGLQFTNTDGINYTVSGTATTTTTLNILEDRNNGMFKPNDDIVVSFQNPQNSLYVEVVTKNGNASTAVLQTTTTGVYPLKLPAVFDYLRVSILFFNGTTYNDNIGIEVKTASRENTIVIAKDGSGDFTKLTEGINEAMKSYGTKVIVKQGTYDLVSEYTTAYLDSLSGGDFGIMLGNGINLVFAPTAYVTFDYDGDNTWIIANFSPFNTANDLGYTIDGLNCVARNCRYILHDDPRPGAKTKYSYNTIKNCYFELYSSPSYPSWVNHQIIGGGCGDSTAVVIENCIFNDHFTGVSKYNAVSYHNSTSGSADYESKITVKDSYFADGNTIGFEGYGSATSKTKVIVTNNSLQNGSADIAYNSSSADNMTLYSWNNAART